MSTVRIAHFSDTHVLSLTGMGPGRFLNKRLTGAVNLALNRSRHYRVEIFEALLRAVKAINPDHSVCTGDLVNLALEPEFERVGQILESHFASDELTVVPGNHDYYVKEAVQGRLFEKTFGQWQPQAVTVGSESGPYPVVRLLNDVAVIGINSAIPTPVFMASGRLGAQQLADMRLILNHNEVKDRFVICLVHHPLLPEPARRLDVTRRLEDADDFIRLLQSEGPKSVDLVVHGHNHEFKRQRVPDTSIPLIQVGSASRAGKVRRAEFNVYVISDGELRSIERHIHDPMTDRFMPCDEAGHPLATDAA
ncbi:MAG: metallophosphoesterase [Myxococcota bacterium]|nr:metallophosphoesterase [Myxococcota bacterium]